jgi:hypothetical protein
MRVTKWVQDGKSKTRVDTDLERFDLYLHVEEDAELIDLLKKYRKRHRTGQRIRDLLYAGLAAEQADKPRLALPARASVSRDEPRQTAQHKTDEEMLAIASQRVLDQFG